MRTDEMHFRATVTRISKRELEDEVCIYRVEDTDSFNSYFVYRPGPVSFPSETYILYPSDTFLQSEYEQRLADIELSIYTTHRTHRGSLKISSFTFLGEKNDRSARKSRSELLLIRIF